MRAEQTAEVSFSAFSPSRHGQLSPSLPAASATGGDQVRGGVQAGERGRGEVDLVGAVVLVRLQVAVRVPLRFVDGDSHRGKVEQGGGQVVCDVAGQPALPAHQGDKVLLAQQSEEEEGEGEEPEKHRDEEHKVHGPLVLVGSDGDPQTGAQQDLEEAQDPVNAPENLHHTLPHLRLGGHLRGNRQTGIPERRGVTEAILELQTERVWGGGGTKTKTRNPKASEERGFLQPPGFEMARLRFEPSASSGSVWLRCLSPLP